VIVGESLRLAIVSALRGHEATLRRNGVRPREELLELLDLLLGCHEGTNLAIEWRAADAGNAPPGRVMSNPLAVDTAEAARLLGVSARTVKRLIASGDIPSTTVGRRRLIDREVLEAMARAKGRRVA
jgi:excisionase family DNA binding protein